MGKNSVKNKKQTGKAVYSNVTHSKVGDNSSKPHNSDMAIFISMSQELEEEGKKLFQRRDHEGAMLKFEKALNLLPKNHVDVCHLRSNMAACYMQMGLSEYPRAIHQCNLALEVMPKNTKALLKRARCYEALNRFELAFRDVNTVHNMEPNNIMAIEILERVRNALGKKGKDEKKAEVKLVVEEVISNKMEEEPKKTVKLIFGEDIRCARLPLNCSLLQLWEVIHDRFPSSRAVLIKYRDEEGDLVTITSDEDLRLAEISAVSLGSPRLYIVEVNSEQDPFFERFKREEVHNLDVKQGKAVDNGDAKTVKEARKDLCCIEDWIIEFGHLFKNYVGFDSDAYLNLHELGMKEYSEAMEDTVTSEEAQDLFSRAAEKFQELTTLALFNWGNVHMSRARKRVYTTDDGSRESVLQQIKTTYEWAQLEYTKAGKRYEEALRTKPDFYEAHLALGQQQFEQAKLSWYYAIGNNVDLETWPSEKVLQLYNNAEENMEKGMLLWEELKVQCLRELSEPKKEQNQMQKIGLDGLFKDISADEAAEQAVNMSAQINLLWGTILYERSIMEFKLGLPVWQECLEVGVEKFEHAGASPTDIAVMVKNHCSNNNAVEGLGFKIDEIIQAWNEMYEAKKWQSKFSSFRLEPLLRRRVSKIYHALELA
ncbi:protein MEMO1-like [Hibiscus syriacus]|uniref:Protein MEMO1-like n=1 Tax=Hibiscus syriacus TaxID=106335 RepID=A0A6A3B5Q5_HIBSY|nr:protein MEMO1-like [Hibiscus syriacus]